MLRKMVMFKAGPGYLPGTFYLCITQKCYYLTGLKLSQQMKKFILIASAALLLTAMTGRTQTPDTGPPGIEKLSTVTPEAPVYADLHLVYRIEAVAPAMVFTVGPAAVLNAGMASGYYDPGMNVTPLTAEVITTLSDQSRIRRRVNDITTEKLKGNKIKPAYSMAFSLRYL